MDQMDHGDRGTAAAARSEVCRCGHGRAVHRHPRPGTDCTECSGPVQCVRFRAASDEGAILRVELPALV